MTDEEKERRKKRLKEMINESGTAKRSIRNS